MKNRDASLLAKHKGKRKPAVRVAIAAVRLGRLGGLIGGLARAEALSDDRREEIARRAANVRWGNEKL